LGGFNKLRVISSEKLGLGKTLNSIFNSSPAIISNSSPFEVKLKSGGLSSITVIFAWRDFSYPVDLEETLITKSCVVLTSAFCGIWVLISNLTYLEALIFAPPLSPVVNSFPSR